MKKRLAIIALLFALQASTAWADWIFGSNYKGGEPTANDVETNTANFNNNLSSSDNTVQDALDTLDNLSVTGAPTDAQYLVSASNGSLSAEDVVTEGLAIDYSNGAGTGTFAFDPTEITGGTTWDDGGEASVAWTFNLSGTDPVLTAVSGGFDVTGDFDISSTIEAGSGNITITNSTGNLDGTKIADADLGDITFSGGAVSIDANSVALGTDTTNNYVASVATSSPLSGGAAGSEGAAISLSIADADDDGTTKGAATFTNADFDATTGLVSIASALTRDTEWDSESEVQTAWGGVNIILSSEIDSTGELAGITDYETGSGALVFGTGPVITLAANSTIPNGTGPTVDAAGEIAVDTTDDQLVYYGGAKRVITYKHFKSFTIESPADVDNFLLFKTLDGINITDVECIVDPADTGESVVIDIQERDSAGDNPASVDATITADNDGASDDGSFSNGSIDANDWVGIDIGTVTGTVTQLVVTIYYYIDAE